MKPAISVEDLSKRYRLGTRLDGRYSTLRESIMHAAGSSWNRLWRWAGRLGSHDHAPVPHNQELWALKHVSFQVRQGEAIGIIGRNGAGKSTLLKIISRITPPTSGGVDFRGRVGSLLEVGTGFHAELTGRENLFLSGAIMGMSRKEIARKFDPIVDFAEIAPHIDTPVKRYSSGMYVRLAFAVAAHMDPNILLIDEVLSVGDLAFQRKCMEHAKRLLKRDVTLLFVSHSMFSIKAMCDRAIYLSQGRVALDGSTEDVTGLYEQESRLGMAPWAHEMVGSDPSKCPIYIKEIELLDEHRRPRSLFNYGERMRIRVHFEARERLNNANFNIGFLRSDNIPCCNFNTAMDGYSKPSVIGSGILELRTPPLKLVSELYSVQVLVWDSTFERLYCAQMGQNFHVRHPILNTEFGVFHEPAEWVWDPDPRSGSNDG
jgi:lipopolysaccharide transport system ATP-binding protein